MSERDYRAISDLPLYVRGMVNISPRVFEELPISRLALLVEALRRTDVGHLGEVEEAFARAISQRTPKLARVNENPKPRRKRRRRPTLRLVKGGRGRASE